MKTSATAAQEADEDWRRSWVRTCAHWANRLDNRAGSHLRFHRARRRFLRDDISGASDPRGGGRSRPGRARRPFAVARPTGSMTERIWQPPQNTARPEPCTRGGRSLLVPLRANLVHGAVPARQRASLAHRTGTVSSSRTRRPSPTTPVHGSWACPTVVLSARRKPTPTSGCYSFIGPAVVPEARR